MLFERYLPPGVPEQIIRERVAQLAAEGFSHQLNVQFMGAQLENEELLPEQREAIIEQMGAQETTAAQIQSTIDWHLSLINPAPEPDPAPVEESHDHSEES